MEAIVSEILENILSLLSLEGSFDVEEKEDGIFVSIETEDAGRLIGHNGETLASLQLLVNQIASRQAAGGKPRPPRDETAGQPQAEESKRVIVDVSNWRKGKEDDLTQRAKRWAEEVKESGKPLELEPMPAWQRRVVHLAIEETAGVTSESLGEGSDRHLIISPAESSK